MGRNPDDPDLPAPLAALESLANRPTPISGSERAARIEQARRLMGSVSADCLFLGPGTNLEYFTGLQWELSERLLGVAIPRDGDPFVVCPAFEEARAWEQLSGGPLGPDAAFLTWQEHESPYAIVARGLKRQGIIGGRIALGERLPFQFTNGIGEAVPAAELVDGIPITSGCRRIKDEHEHELLRIASKITLKAFKATFEAIRPGMTQEDVSELVSLAHERLGFEGHAGIQVGEHASRPHGSEEPKVLREDSVVLLDGGCNVEGYCSDISRTFVLGEPSEWATDVFDVVRRAQDAALAAAGPRVEAQTVDAAARKVVSEAGYGPEYRYFAHRVGHGLGMDGHEWPYLVQGSELSLEPGMTFSNEPGIYIDGAFGVRLEDDMVITDDGAELFTPQSSSLIDPFGTSPAGLF